VQHAWVWDTLSLTRGTDVDARGDRVRVRPRAEPTRRRRRLTGRDSREISISSLSSSQLTSQLTLETRNFHCSFRTPLGLARFTGSPAVPLPSLPPVESEPPQTQSEHDTRQRRYRYGVCPCVLPIGHGSPEHFVQPTLSLFQPPSAYSFSVPSLPSHPSESLLPTFPSRTVWRRHAGLVSYRLQCALMLLCGIGDGFHTDATPAPLI
jgi:hypothetical protein